jgi:hypothetical protein
MRTTQRCFKIVVYAQDGWIWGAVQCDAKPSFAHFDAHGQDCDPMPQFYLLQVQQSLPRRARKPSSKFRTSAVRLVPASSVSRHALPREPKSPSEVTLAGRVEESGA